MAVKAIPDGRDHIMPILTVKGAAMFLDFLREAFGAMEAERHAAPDGTIMHAETRIRNSIVMTSEANEEFPPAPARLQLYVDDVDAVYQRAIAAGATSLREPENQFYGDRSAGVADAFGNQWWLATHVEDVSPEEMQRWMAQAQGK